MIPSLIFLVDGYDEAGPKCQNLVKEVLNICSNGKKRASCIVTSRVEAADNLLTKLSESSIQCCSLSFKKITDINDQMSFLQKYSDALNKGDPNEMVQTFGTLLPEVQKVFSTPFMLTLFCRLFLENKASGILTAKSAQDVYQAFVVNCINKMTTLIKENSWAERVRPSSLAHKIMGRLCLISLGLWRENGYVVSVREINELTDELHGKKWCSAETDWTRILSCILSPEESQSLGEVTYAFPHLSILEFLAARQITDDLLKEVLRMERSILFSWQNFCSEKMHGVGIEDKRRENTVSGYDLFKQKKLPYRPVIFNLFHLTAKCELGN